MKNKSLISLIFGLLFLSVISAQAQKFMVSGNIKDKGKNEPLIGVNVVEIDENGRYISGTITDVNGNFILQVSSPESSILVSYIGYLPEVVELSGREKLEIGLEENILKLDEVTVTGEKIGSDGVMAIRDRAIAVSRIEMEELKSTMTTTVEEMLQGRLGNVDITSVSGDPGAGLNIRIRGTATLFGNNEPLIVVNGIPYNPSLAEFDFASADVEKFGNLIDVAPEDIEAIEVLKDAGSTAIWGSKAANGVIMIQTKRGKKSKPIFNYTMKLTKAYEPDPIPMLEGGDYSKLIAQAHYNLDDRQSFFNSNNSREISYNKEELQEDFYNYAQNTSWIDLITRDPWSYQHNFSVRGGGEKSRYTISTGIQDDRGTTINTNQQKLNINSSFDYDISSKLRFTSDVMYTHYDQNANYDMEDEFYKNEKSLRSIAYRKMPNLSAHVRDTNNVVYDEYFTPNTTLQGNAKDIPNPLAFASLAKHKRVKDNLRAGFNVKYRITPALTFTSSINLDIFDNKTEKFLPYKAVGYNYGDNITNQATDSYQKKSSIFNYTKLIYDPALGEKHDLVLLGQFDAETTNERGFLVRTSRSASEHEQTTYNNPIIKQEALVSEFRSLGFFASANYKFNDKYIINIGAKYEGNSKYSREARWKLFPSTSVAWRISEEWPFKNVGFINDFRLRGSWGQSGNVPTDNYLYFNTYRAGTELAYLDLSGVEPTGIELTSLIPEVIEQTNLGFSFTGLRHRLYMEFDIYRKTTHDLFLKDSDIPEHSGFGKLNRNDGELRNDGVEFSMDYKVIDNSNFKASFNFNIAHNQNIVIKWPQNYSLERGNMSDNDQYLQVIRPGYAMGGFFGYQYNGAYPTTESTYVRGEDGQYIYETGQELPMVMLHGGSSYFYEAGDAWYTDQNYDGKIDKLDVIYLGDINPDLTGGFGPRLQYQSLTFNCFFYFRLGQEIINQTRSETERMYNYDNQSTATYRYWRKEGDITNIPRPLYNEGYNFLGSSRFVEDGSFIRLKTISLSYDFPDLISNRINVNNINTYVTVYNLKTWTNYTGQDPEVGLPGRPDDLPKDYSRTPPSTRITLGVNITF